MERKSGRTWDKWKVELGTLSPKTKLNYLSVFDRFLEYADLDTESLYQLFMDTEHSKDPLDRGAVKDKVLSYLSEMDRERMEEKGKPYSNTQKRMVVYALKSFFSACNENLDMNGKTPKQRKSGGSRIITKDEFREIVKFILPKNKRDMSIVYTARDSGLRISDIANMRLKHVKTIIEDPTVEWIQFTITQQKTNEESYPALGPESVRRIRDWLMMREHRGLDNTDPEGPLYVNLQTNDPYLRNGVEIGGSKFGDQIASDNISGMFRALVKSAGFEGQKLSAHSLRKYHSTRTVVGGLSDSMMKTLQGKDLGDSTEPYMDFTESELMDRYKAAYHELAVEASGESIVRKIELNGLKSQVQELQELSGYDDEWKKILENENKELKERLDKMEAYMRIIAEGREK